MSSAVPSARKPTFGRVAGRIALFVATGLLTGELALRGVDALQGRDPFGPTLPPQNSIILRYQPHPYMGYALNPRYEGQGINALGLRGEMVSRSKPDGVFRILCLGGSTTYGSHTRAEESYPARLQQELNDAEHETPPLRYEVLNCGVPGYTTAESLINFELRLLEFDADALIIYHAINDARIFQVGGFLPDYSHMRSSWHRESISSFEWGLLRHSRVYFRLFGDRYPDPTKLRLERLVYVDPGEHPHPAPNWKGVNPAGVATYLRNLHSIIALARANGIAPVLTSFAASPEHLTGKGYKSVLKAINDQVRRFAADKRIPLIELADPLGSRPELFADYVHLNAEGCRAQAHQILVQARAQGLWRLRR